MSKPSQRNKPSPSSKAAARDSATGRFTGTVGEADAKRFYEANTAFMREVSGSKAKAIKALKASGFLTSSGKVAKRYR